jgi:hypothetical protein
MSDTWFGQMSQWKLTAHCDWIEIVMTNNVSLVVVHNGAMWSRCCNGLLRLHQVSHRLQHSATGKPTVTNSYPSRPSDMNHSVTVLTPTQRRRRYIRHSLQLVTSWQSSSQHSSHLTTQTSRTVTHRLLISELFLRPPSTPLVDVIDRCSLRRRDRITLFMLYSWFDWTTIVSVEFVWVVHCLMSWGWIEEEDRMMQNTEHAHLIISLLPIPPSQRHPIHFHKF